MTVSAVQATRLLEEIQQVQGQNAAHKTNGTSGTQFQNLLSDLVENVKETENAVRQDMVNLALGEADALHNILINSAKADLAVQTLVAVRNKALDAYNELMRITL
jgi:flagellar hook-basal body complex protein FliE